MAWSWKNWPWSAAVVDREVRVIREIEVEKIVTVDRVVEKVVTVEKPSAWDQQDFLCREYAIAKWERQEAEHKANATLLSMENRYFLCRSFLSKRAALAFDKAWVAFCTPDPKPKGSA